MKGLYVLKVDESQPQYAVHLIYNLAGTGAHVGSAAEQSGPEYSDSTQCGGTNVDTIVLWYLLVRGLNTCLEVFVHRARGQPLSRYEANCVSRLLCGRNRTPFTACSYYSTAVKEGSIRSRWSHPRYAVHPVYNLAVRCACWFRY